MDRTVLLTMLMSSILVGCSGDSNGFLDKPAEPDTPPPLPPIVEEVIADNLIALPQIYQLAIDQSQNVSVLSSVLTTNNINWQLTNAQSEQGLGAISARTTTGFNYLATATGIDTVSYTVAGSDLTSSSQILFAINEIDAITPPENTPPAVENIVKNTDSATTVMVNLLDYVSDADGHALTISRFVTGSTRFTHQDGQVTYTPDGYIGVDQAVYAVSDGHGGNALAYLLMNVSDSNSPPIARNYSMNLDVAVTPTWTIDLTALDLINDPNNEPLTLTHIFDSNDRAVIASDTVINYTPTQFTGVDQFSYQITDNQGESAIATITVTVSDSTPQNAIPSATPITTTTLSNQDIMINVTGKVTDADNDVLQISQIIGSDGRATLNPNQPLQINYQPAGFEGIDVFEYVISDSNGGFAQSTITVDVNHHNQNAPVAQTAQLNLQVNDTNTLDLNGYISDIESPNNDLNITQISSATAPATANLNGKIVNYSSNDFIGTDVLTYTVTDGKYSTDGNIVVTVNPEAAHTLTANPISISVAAGSVATPIKLLDSVEITGSNTALPLNITSVTSADLGTFTLVGDIFTYTPTAGQYGTDELLYHVADSHSPSHTATGVIKVIITPPAAPIITTLSVNGVPGAGQLLTPNLTCSSCDPTLYQYQWTSNGLNVGSGATYTLQATDMHQAIRLTVTGQDSYQQTTTEHITISPKVIKTIFGKISAFAALTHNGEVITWGGNSSGGDSSNVSAEIAADVEHVYLASYAMAALKSDGSLVTWGSNTRGGDSSAVDVSANIADVVGNAQAFAALKADGSVVSWGNVAYGGDSSAIVSLNSNVEKIFTNGSAFAALKTNGSVITWGDAASGGDSSSVDISSNVKNVYYTRKAFAALKYDGTVVAWGHTDNGGDASAVAAELTNIVDISATHYAFAAIKSNSDVVAWGHSTYGGNKTGLTGVKSITAGRYAFAAIQFDGSVTAWGSSSSGGNTSAVAAHLSSDVETIVASRGNFIAKKTDDSYVTWGTYNDNSVRTNIKQIYPADTTVAYLYNDGSVEAIGNQDRGGDTSGVAAQISTGVDRIYVNDNAFAAVKDDGSVVTWGEASAGADSSTVQTQLTPHFIVIENTVN